MGWRSRVKINTAALIIAFLLGMLSLGFAGVAVYFTLLNHYPAHIAALITASMHALAALLVLLVTRLVTARNRAAPASPPKKPQGIDDLENLLAALVSPELGKLIKQHPGKSVLITLLAGLAVGCNDETRSAAKKMYRQFFEEQE